MLNTIKIEDSPYSLVHNDPERLKIGVVEESHGATYIGMFCLGKDGQFANNEFFVFYQPVAHPRGSNYCALYYHPLKDGWFITVAISVTQHSWTGVLIPDTNEILYSAYRHDCQEYKDIMADGGADYLRTDANVSTIQFVIRDGKIYLEEKQDEQLQLSSGADQIASASQR